MVKLLGEGRSTSHSAQNAVQKQLGRCLYSFRLSIFAALVELEAFGVRTFNDAARQRLLHCDADHNRNDQASRRSKTTNGRRLLSTTVLLREYPAPHHSGSWWIDAYKPRTTSITTNLPTTTSIAFRLIQKREHRGAHGVVKSVNFSDV
eukprot:2074983-Pleurochrysis_carterae.AAC.4